MSTSKRRHGPESRTSSGSGLLYKALGSSAAIVAVTALPAFAVGSDDIDLDSDLDVGDDLAMSNDVDMPEGFEDAVFADSIDEVTEAGVYEIGFTQGDGEADPEDEADEVETGIAEGEVLQDDVEEAASPAPTADSDVVGESDVDDADEDEDEDASGS